MPKKNNYHFIIAVVLFSYPNFLFSQNIIRGKIIESISGEPIPFVNIGIKRLASGTVSSEHGIYELTIEKAQPNDQVTISSIGFEPKMLSLQTLRNNPTIQLQAKTYTIENIQLSAKKWHPKTVIIGNTTRKRKQSVGFGNSQLGTEIGALLPIEKETWIKSAHFVVNRGSKDSLLFRLNIFEYNNGQLGKNLVQENILLPAPQNNGLMSIDLEKYNLVTAQPILLSLQWIKAYEGNGKLLITFNAKKSASKNNLFLKPYSVSDFGMISDSFPGAPKYELCFYVEGQQVKK